MVDSAADPVDGPTKLEQREAADREGDGYTPISERKARNIRDYHQSEINRLTRAIEQHQAIVDAQDEILSHPSTLPDDEPLAPGTDIGDQFNHPKPIRDMTVEELQNELRDRDLPVSGNRGELIDRIEDFDDSSEDDDPNPDDED